MLLEIDFTHVTFPGHVQHVSVHAKMLILQYAMM